MSRLVPLQVVVEQQPRPRLLACADCAFTAFLQTEKDAHESGTGHRVIAAAVLVEERRLLIDKLRKAAQAWMTGPPPKPRTIESICDSLRQIERFLWCESPKLCAGCGSAEVVRSYRSWGQPWGYCAPCWKRVCTDNTWVEPGHWGVVTKAGQRFVKACPFCIYPAMRELRCLVSGESTGKGFEPCERHPGYKARMWRIVPP